MTKEVIIIPGCTDLNRGDQALVWESASLIKDACSDVRFCLLESGTKKDDIYLQSKQTRALGFKVIPKILLHPSRITQNSTTKKVKYSKTDYILWGFQSVFDLFFTSLLLSRFTILNSIGRLFLTDEQKETLKHFKSSHAVVVKGGGFIHAFGKVTDFYTMYFSLYHALLAIRYKKLVLIFPNSIGPVKGPLSRKLVKYVLSKCKLITVREKVSRTYLKNSLGLSSKLFPDLGFYLQPKQKDYTSYYLKKNVPLGAKRLVGITLRPYRFPDSTDPNERYHNYITEIIRFVKLSIDNNFHPVFFAHTLGPSSHEDDRLAIADVLKQLPETTKSCFSYIEDFDLDCKDIMGLYSHLDFMVGTRFHSVIFALNENVPCIAIAYGGNKSFGIMTDMGLSEFVYPIEDFKGEKLYSMLEMAINNKASYIEKIKKYRKYLERSREELSKVIANLLK